MKLGTYKKRVEMEYKGKGQNGSGGQKENVYDHIFLYTSDIWNYVNVY